MVSDKLNVRSSGFAELSLGSVVVSLMPLILVVIAVEKYPASGFVTDCELKHSKFESVSI